MARFAVGVLRGLGLTVVADDAAGHALIPQLSVEACQRDKKGTREIQVRLAELASKNIVHAPDD